jgi:competence ComEA-like helix-hairpin-helix protein
MTEIRQKRTQLYASVISELICITLAAGFAVSGLTVRISAKSIGGIVPDEKINPNEAPAVSLSRLPNIGYTRAQAIIAYKESIIEKNGDITIFKDCNDLQKVKGIGPKTVQNINKWLKFE